MSATVKLSGKLPGDPDINGLDAHRDDLLKTPEKVRLVLGWVDVDKITEVVATGEHVPTLVFRRLELVGDADNAPPELKELALRLYEARTGKSPLPIDQVTAPTSERVD